MGASLYIKTIIGAVVLVGIVIASFFGYFYVQESKRAAELESYFENPESQAVVNEANQLSTERLAELDELLNSSLGSTTDYTALRLQEITGGAGGGENTFAKTLAAAGKAAQRFPDLTWHDAAANDPLWGVRLVAQNRETGAVVGLTLPREKVRIWKSAFIVNEPLPFGLYTPSDIYQKEFFEFGYLAHRAAGYASTLAGGANIAVGPYALALGEIPVNEYQSLYFHARGEGDGSYRASILVKQLDIDGRSMAECPQKASLSAGLCAVVVNETYYTVEIGPFVPDDLIL